LEPDGIKFVEITPEDHIFVEDIYKQIINEYMKRIKSGIGNSPAKIDTLPTFQVAVKFLRERAIFNKNDIKNFVTQLVRNQK
jgi:hypothetical protein